VPYIKAGLEDNEFCMWITGEPITVNDAVHALEQTLPNVQEYLANKQLEILPHTQCYFSTGIFDAEVVLYNWLNQARGAEAKGLLVLVLPEIFSGSGQNRIGSNSAHTNKRSLRTSKINESLRCVPTLLRSAGLTM
jgi:hypothetical protein